MDNSKVQRWLQYIGQRRPKTAKYYSVALQKFEKITGVRPEDLLKMSDKKRCETLEDYLRTLQHHTPKTRAVYIGVIKSFLVFHRKPTRLAVKIRGLTTTPTLRNERIPDPGQIRELLNRMPPRLKASAALIAFAGLRFETQVDLRLGDMLDFDTQNIRFTRTPAAIYVPAEASKNGRQYFTFLIKEGCEHIEAYLRNRRDGGELLTEDSYLISQRGGEKLNSNTLTRLIREMTHKVIHSRAYVLRSYFNTSLLAAGVHPDWKRFFTGHTGDIEDIYSTRKLLPEWAVEKMREQFQPAANQLATQKPDTRQQEKAAALAALKVLEGYQDVLGIKVPLKELKHRLEAVETPA